MAKASTRAGKDHIKQKKPGLSAGNRSTAGGAGEMRTGVAGDEDTTEAYGEGDSESAPGPGSIVSNAVVHMGEDENGKQSDEGLMNCGRDSRDAGLHKRDFRSESLLKHN